MLDGIPVGNLTAPALLGITVLMVLLGWIVPRYVYREKVKEADNWRKAYEIEHTARLTSDAQTVQLLEQAKTTHSVIVAMFDLVSGQARRPSGEANVVSTPTGS